MRVSINSIAESLQSDSYFQWEYDNVDENEEVLEMGVH